MLREYKRQEEMVGTNTEQQLLRIREDIAGNIANYSTIFNALSKSYGIISVASEENAPYGSREMAAYYLQNEILGTGLDFQYNYIAIWFPKQQYVVCTQYNYEDYFLKDFYAFSGMDEQLMQQLINKSYGTHFLDIHHNLLTQSIRIKGGKLLLILDYDLDAIIRNFLNADAVYALRDGEKIIYASKGELLDGDKLLTVTNKTTRISSGKEEYAAKSIQLKTLPYELIIGLPLTIQMSDLRMYLRALILTLILMLVIALFVSMLFAGRAYSPMPSLKSMYSADDDSMQMYWLKDATATFCSFTAEPEIINF